MKHHPQPCSSCGCLINGLYCVRCLQRYQDRMARLEAMPGHPNIPEPSPPERTKRELKTLHAYAELRHALVEALDVAIGVDRAHAPTERERCSGNTTIWKDDESGASSSWDSVVRAYEDIDMEESSR